MTIDAREKGLAVGDADGGGAKERDEEREIRDLEAEVSKMADIIQEARRSLPGKLGEALSKQLAARRPRVAVDGAVGLRDYTSQNESASGEAELDGRASLEGEEEMLDKLQALRSKLRSNIEVMPSVLKRIKKCIERVNRLDQSNVTINPVFKKRRKN